ncbi:hypothetical protein IPZ59_11955 [Mongoliitalea daihaiensis]|nr:hypothetical protein IPZ59_11955 [Mongoliitalea daihaiensis]
MCKVFILLTLVNFINLSADFYTSDSLTKKRHTFDPIDTLAELVIEYFLDMDDEIIPDTEVPQEQRKFKDLKLYHQTFEIIQLLDITSFEQKLFSFYFNLFESIKLDIHSPPPKLIFLKLILF